MKAPAESGRGWIAACQNTSSWTITSSLLDAVPWITHQARISIQAITYLVFVASAVRNRWDNWRWCSRLGSPAILFALAEKLSRKLLHGV